VTSVFAPDHVTVRFRIPPHLEGTEGGSWYDFVSVVVLRASVPGALAPDVGPALTARVSVVEATVSGTTATPDVTRSQGISDWPAMPRGDTRQYSVPLHGDGH